MIGITPYLVKKAPGELQDMCTDVYKYSAGLEASVRPGLRSALVDLLLFVNSYYSNKMEGNPTKPVDVIKAQKTADLTTENSALVKGLEIAVAGGESSKAATKAHAAITEILAHARAQRYLSEHLPTTESVVTTEFIKVIHDAFFSHLSVEQRQIIHPDTNKIHVVEPGCFRQTGVIVGNHVAPEYTELDSYLGWFSKAYRLDWMHGNDRLLAAAAAHHRLLWIHPFLDGNGRVCRLLTEVYMRLAGVEAAGLWSISRGFSRDIERYKASLAHADQPRQGSSDGRGVLSDRGLLGFQTYFLQTCLQQISYVQGLLDIQTFDKRLHVYVAMRTTGSAVDTNGQLLPKWRPQTALLLRAVINQPRVMRSQVPEITGLGETMSRKMVNQLCEEGWLEGAEKKPLQLQIPFDGISALFPHLW